MPSVPSLPSLAYISDFLESDRPAENIQSPESERAVAFDLLRGALTSYLEMPGEAEAWRQFRSARRAACEVIARMPRQPDQIPDIHEVHELVREMSKTGVHDLVVDSEDLTHAQTLAGRDWRGILAAMLLVPAWQWPAAPLLLEVPDWLRADYVRWLFAAPNHFTAPDQAKAYAAFTLQRLEELVRWMKRRPGGQEEMKVLGAYASHSSLIPACFGTDSLRRQAELRGQLLQRAMGCRDDRYQAPLVSRAGRRLRIGIIHRHFESSSEIYSTLPLFEELDPDRFEVVLFTYVSDFNRIEEHCRKNSSGGLLLLPPDLKGQLATLRQAALDVVLFSANITAECNVVTRLALHRVAPLQVVHNSSCFTSGLAEIDLYLSGELGAEKLADQFSERLGLMPGPTHFFELGADHDEPQTLCTRADFGLPEDACVFVSTANFRKITPEVQQSWVRLLAEVPGSYLLLHPFHSPQPTGHTIHQFHGEFEGVLRREGVDPSRLVASTVVFPSRTDVQGLVGLGDIYLDTFPFSAVDSLVDPFQLGLPVVTLSGDTLRARTGASLLRALGLGDLVQESSAGYRALAIRLANDAVFRERCGQRTRAMMAESPVFLNSRAASAAFGDLMERAFDELAEHGRLKFRSDLNPLKIAMTDRVGR